MITMHRDSEKREILHFYLGSHNPAWLCTSLVIPKHVPLFVSDVRLRTRRGFKKSIRRWALDSGGFSEISQHGKWLTTPEDYCRRIARYDKEIGGLDWAAAQDWMCEPFIIEKTGKSVREHQELTVASYLELSSLWPQYSDDSCPVMPVLQGFHIDEYWQCFELYESAGVSLIDKEVVGVGSVCRRQGTNTIKGLLRELASKLDNIHAFGLKLTGLRNCVQYLASADSMAWSFAARRSEPLPGCAGHKNCANCPRYALRWYEQVLKTIANFRFQYELWDDKAMCVI